MATMAPISVVALLFWVALIASIISLFRDGLLRGILKAHWKALTLLLVLSLAWRVPLDGVFFHGLEYEDSYIYTVAGRQMVEHASPALITSVSPFSINVCQVGSLKNCLQWEPFPEHLIGYPYVISVVAQALRYTPSVGSIVNLAASCISVLLVFCIALFISDDPNVASTAGAIFAATPVFAVCGLETSAEPFSNACIALVVWLYLRLFEGYRLGRRDQVTMWIAYISVLLFTQTVKRENILLAGIMLIMMPFMFRPGEAPRRERYIAGSLVLVTSGFAVILSLKMHLLQTSSNEMELLRQFPMTPGRLASFIVGFLRSFVIFGWYGGTFVAVILGVVVACMRRGRTLLPLTLLAAYILLYASHIRSYYEMKSGLIEPQAALRFSMNFMALWAILGGLGVGSIATRIGGSRIWNRHRRLCLYSTEISAALLLAVAFVATIRLRDYEVEDERISRLTPAATAIKFASNIDEQSDFIVSMEPLVIQMYAGTGTRIVDLESVDSTMMRTLTSSGKRFSLLYLEEHDRFNNSDLTRYGEQTRYLSSLPSVTLYRDDRFQIKRIGSPVRGTQ